ncbi:MAG TPA: FtsX-like permease family protein [Polyangiaceae bacterium]|nr:FtsX-like permease family protein [Polyangiaceae bacterium]
MFALIREISLRHWARSPLRSVLIVLGIALGVALYVATEATSASMMASFGEIVERVAGRADLTVVGSGSGVPSELVADVAETPGVAHAASSLEITTQAVDFKESLLVLGVDFLGDMHFLPFDVKSGEERVIEDPLAFVNDPTALLVSGKFAARHHLAKGSTVKLLTAEGPKDFVVRGVLADTGPAASFGGQVAVMFVDAAQVSFARGTLVDRIDVALEKTADPAAVRAALQEKVGKGFRVEKPDRMGSKLRELTEPLRTSLSLSGYVSLLVGAFLVYNAVGIAVVQRRREIGVLRALGTTRLKIVLLFCLEAALLALPGVLLGLFVARLLSRYTSVQAEDAMTTLYVAVAPSAPKITPALALRGFAAGVTTAVLAAFVPARRGASLDPAIVLRGASAVERSRLRYGRLAIIGSLGLAFGWLPFFRGTLGGGAISITAAVVGSTLMTPAIVVLIRRLTVRGAEGAFGIPARLGLDYVERTLGRSTINVLALMVGVSMSVSVGGWLASFEKSLTEWFEQMSVADLSVTSGSPILDQRHLALSADAPERVRGVPGVGRVQSFRMTDQETEGKTFRLVATDTDVFLEEARKHGRGWPVVEGDPVAVGDLSSAPRILLGESASRRLGKHAGDSLVLHGTKGDVTFQVRGIIVDYTSDKGAGFVDLKVFRDHWGDEAVDALSVYVADGAKAETVADGIRTALGGGSSIFVTKTEEVRKQIIDTLQRTFSYSRSVELVTLLIALMGVAGTMLSAVLDRAREIGMLRAIGATTRQVAASIVVEASFLGFCGIVAGSMLGVLECLLFLKTLLLTDTGWHLDFVFPWVSTARMSLLSMATCALAGGLPAIRAAKTDVTAAVVYE